MSLFHTEKKAPVWLVLWSTELFHVSLIPLQSTAMTVMLWNVRTPLPVLFSPSFSLRPCEPVAWLNETVSTRMCLHVCTCVWGHGIWMCAYLSDYSSVSHVWMSLFMCRYRHICAFVAVKLYLWVCVCVCVCVHDGNFSLFASQFQSQSIERGSSWCRYPNRGHLNRADMLLAHPTAAPNCPWQYKMHPIGCSTVVQFAWPLV